MDVKKNKSLIIPRWFYECTTNDQYPKTEVLNLPGITPLYYNKLISTFALLKKDKRKADEKYRNIAVTI